jgi:2,3-bisphosphoglycerate-dependent phosphoglycerate mutase
VNEGGFPYRLVLLRHGQSEWNAAQVFTGWENAHLTARGELEAARAEALQGRSKPEVIRQDGEQQVMTWRRSYDVPPPPLADAAARAADPRYRAVPPDALPRAESLADVDDRIAGLEIPTGTPLVYQLGPDLRPDALNGQHLDPHAARDGIAAVTDPEEVRHEERARR